MWLFGKKKALPEKKSALPMTARVVHIPDAFYGGVDPLIYASEGVKSGQVKPMSSMQQGAPTMVKKSSLPLATFWTRHKRVMLIASSIVFIVFIGAVSWYYVQKATSSTILPSAPPPPVAPPQSAEPTATSTIAEPPPPTEPVVPPPITPSIPREHLGEFPTVNVLDTADLDADQLTDEEEDLFRTDASIWDTDKDGYYDGQEVGNLYNPIGFAPVKIIDSGLAREYVNSAWQYRLYYPDAWEVGDVDTGGNQVIFSGSSGDFIEAHSFVLTGGETFQQWFARTVATQQFTDLQQVSNRFGVDYWKRRDGLVAYFPTSGSVHVIIYHPKEEGPIAFRHVMLMILQSMRSSVSTATLPDQNVLP